MSARDLLPKWPLRQFKGHHHLFQWSRKRSNIHVACISSPSGCRSWLAPFLSGYGAMLLDPSWTHMESYATKPLPDSCSLELSTCVASTSTLYTPLVAYTLLSDFHLGTAPLDHHKLPLIPEINTPRSYTRTHKVCNYHNAQFVHSSKLYTGILVISVFILAWAYLPVRLLTQPICSVRRGLFVTRLNVPIGTTKNIIQQVLWSTTNQPTISETPDPSN